MPSLNFVQSDGSESKKWDGAMSIRAQASCCLHRHIVLVYEGTWNPMVCGSLSKRAHQGTVGHNPRRHWSRGLWCDWCPWSTIAKMPWDRLSVFSLMVCPLCLEHCLEYIRCSINFLKLLICHQKIELVGNPSTSIKQTFESFPQQPGVQG